MTFKDSIFPPSYFLLLHFPWGAITQTDIAVWVASALLAVGIGWSRYAKWKTRDKLVRDIARMDPEAREKMLRRLNPALAMEIRQELMKRYRMMT